MTYEEALKIPVNAVRKKLGYPKSHLAQSQNAINYVETYLKLCSEDHTLFDVIRWLSKMFPSVSNKKLIKRATTSNEWHVIKTNELKEIALLRYLENRGIDQNIARKYLKEIQVRNTDRETLCAVAFPNEDGGYAVLNSFVETQVGKLAISVIRRGEGIPPVVHLFTDFLDMLSAFTAFPYLCDNADVICLNSPLLIASAFSYIAGFGYKRLYSWFPNTAQGQMQINSLSSYVKTSRGLKHMVCNAVYDGFKSIAAWHEAEITKT